MDPLTQELVNRQLQTQPQAGVVPPNPAPRVPQATKRFENAQAIQDAYRGNWTPNPILLRATLGNH